jgi:hypothetical protein
MQDPQFWSRISNISHAMLAELLDATGEQKVAAQCEPPKLCLLSDSRSLLDHLLQLGLTRASAQKCDNIFVADTEVFASKLEAQFTASWRSLDSNVGEQELQVARAGLCRLYTSRLHEGVESIKETVLAFVRSRPAHASERGAGPVEVGENRTWDLKSNPRAKELLEDVFQKNQNPNAAEKNEMAVATGLTKKQITTWVSGGCSP